MLKTQGVINDRVHAATSQEMETLAVLSSDVTHKVKLPFDPAKGYSQPNPDGTLTLIAACPIINGIPWPIPAGVEVEVPGKIYELLDQADSQVDELSYKQRMQSQSVTGRRLRRV